MKDGQILVEAKETGIQPFDKFEAEIVEFEKINAEKTFDLTTEVGLCDCEDYLKKLRKVEIEIEKTRKIKGADLLKATKDLNASAKVWHARVHAMYEVIDKPLQVIRQIALNAAIDAKEKEDAAAKAIEDKRLADLEEREAEVTAKAAELKEKEDAVNATKIAQDLEEAKLTAANNAVIAEQAKATANRQRVIDEQLAREADEEHRKKYNNLALDAIVAIIDDPATSLRLVKAIVKNKIPNVTMNY